MFLIIEHFVFLVKFIMNLNISDVPEEVQMQLDRLANMNYINSRN
jgi:hypothetical protein